MAKTKQNRQKQNKKNPYTNPKEKKILRIQKDWHPINYQVHKAEGKYD